MVLVMEMAAFIALHLSVQLGGAAAAESCAGQNNTGCTMTRYATPTAADAATCCSLCTAQQKCQAWTFHAPSKGGCYLSDSVDCRAVPGAVGGCKKPPCKTAPPPGPAPAPPAPPEPPKFPNFCKDKKCKNVLYFVADDMRADWGTYGLPVKTPNLDALSKKSVLFEHAYCQLSVNDARWCPRTHHSAPRPLSRRAVPHSPPVCRCYFCGRSVHRRECLS